MAGSTGIGTPDGYFEDETHYYASLNYPEMVPITTEKQGEKPTARPRNDVIDNYRDISEENFQDTRRGQPIVPGTKGYNYNTGEGILKVQAGPNNKDTSTAEGWMDYSHTMPKANPQSSDTPGSDMEYRPPTPPSYSGEITPNWNEIDNWRGKYVDPSTMSPRDLREYLKDKGEQVPVQPAPLAPPEKNPRRPMTENEDDSIPPNAKTVSADIPPDSDLLPPAGFDAEEYKSTLPTGASKNFPTPSNYDEFKAQMEVAKVRGEKNLEAFNETPMGRFLDTLTTGMMALPMGRMGKGPGTDTVNVGSAWKPKTMDVANDNPGPQYETPLSRQLRQSAKEADDKLTEMRSKLRPNQRNPANENYGPSDYSDWHELSKVDIVSDANGRPAAVLHKELPPGSPGKYAVQIFDPYYAKLEMEAGIPLHQGRQVQENDYVFFKNKEVAKEYVEDALISKGDNFSVKDQTQLKWDYLGYDRLMSNKKSGPQLVSDNPRPIKNTDMFTSPGVRDISNIHQSGEGSAANQNIAGLYNPREPNMIGGPEPEWPPKEPWVENYRDTMTPEEKALDTQKRRGGFKTVGPVTENPTQEPQAKDTRGRGDRSVEIQNAYLNRNNPDRVNVGPGKGVLNDNVTEVTRMMETGATPAQIADRYGITPLAVRGWIKRRPEAIAKLEPAAVEVQGKMYRAQSHWEAAEKAMQDLNVDWDSVKVDKEGFYTNKGRFITREEAAGIAKKMKQIHPNVDPADVNTLMSEDLTGQYGLPQASETFESPWGFSKESYMGVTPKQHIVNLKARIGQIARDLTDFNRRHGKEEPHAGRNQLAKLRQELKEMQKRYEK